MKFDKDTLVLLAGAALAVWYVTYHLPGAAPLSIYPEFAWTNTTSMAATAKQQAPTAPQSMFAAAQQQELSAVYAQCAGSWPGCTPLMSDTQLGF